MLCVLSHSPCRQVGRLALPGTLCWHRTSTNVLRGFRVPNHPCLPADVRSHQEVQGPAELDVPQCRPAGSVLGHCGGPKGQAATDCCIAPAGDVSGLVGRNDLHPRLSSNRGGPRRSGSVIAGGMPLLVQSALVLR